MQDIAEIQENTVTQSVIQTTDNNAQKINNINLAIQSFENYNATERRPDDYFDITAKKIASDLRSLNEQQLIIAQKLIAEVIYYAKLNKLNENSTIVLNN